MNPLPALERRDHVRLGRGRLALARQLRRLALALRLGQLVAAHARPRLAQHVRVAVALEHQPGLPVRARPDPRGQDEHAARGAVQHQDAARVGHVVRAGLQRLALHREVERHARADVGRLGGHAAQRERGRDRRRPDQLHEPLRHLILPGQLHRCWPAITDESGACMFGAERAPRETLDLRVSFAEWVLDTATRQLLRAGQPVHLTPKAFELLQALVEERPRALSKAELRARLWPDTHVLEANLPNVAAEVRDTLGDDVRQPRFIRTVHGFGYAFCGEATEAVPSAADEARFVYRLAWEGGVVALAEGEYLLGRHPHSVLPTDRDTVSRRHARLRIAGGEAVLEDLQSRNGTFVRGTRLTGPATLADGDEFRVGSVAITFRVSRSSGDTETRDA